jgi:hypothetical protein
MATWEGNDLISQAMRIMRPDGYWGGVEAAVQDQRMKDFERSIYPIWCSVAEKDRVAEEKLTSAQVHAPGQVMFEVSTVHRQDIAIHESGKKPDGELVPTAALRKKAAVSDRYSSWKG